jgi:hypothetical protein
MTPQKGSMPGDVRFHIRAFMCFPSTNYRHHYSVLPHGHATPCGSITDSGVLSRVRPSEHTLCYSRRFRVSSEGPLTWNPLRKRAEHAEVYHGTAPAGVERVVAWLLTNLSPVVLVEVLVGVVSSSSVLR